MDRKTLVNRAVGVALLASLLAIAAKNMVVDLDLFHEMALYRQMELEGAMPTTDAFAYTKTNDPVVHHEWATGAILYWICVRWGTGAAGLVATKYLLTFAVGLGCFLLVRRRGVDLPVFTVLVPVALNLGGWMAFTNIRAQLFTLVFLVALLWLLDVDRRGGRWWIAIWLPMVVIWGNVHGGVVSGLGLIGCYGIARTCEAWIAHRSIKPTFLAVRHLVFTGLATAGLLNVSPYGWEYVPYLIRAIRMPRPLIPEWNPVWNLETNDALIFWAVSVVIAGVAVWKSGLKLREGHGDHHSPETSQASEPDMRRTNAYAYELFTPLALLLTAWMAAKHYRHGSLYAVTWICLVPPLLQPTPIARAIENLWHRYAATVGVLATGIAVVALGYSIQARFWELRIPGQRAYQGEPILVYPVGPVQYLADAQFEGNLFVPFNLGAFVSWKLWPAVKVSIDSRYEVAYPPGALEQNLSFYYALDDWRQAVEQTPTDAILIPLDQPVAERLGELQSPSPDGGGGWTLCYQDQEFLLLVRSELAQHLPRVDNRKAKVVGRFP